jgi:hypothetical protein
MRFCVFALGFVILISACTEASVSREISIEMSDIDNFKLTKSRVYTGNETSMIREQLDRDFGNNDGFLGQNEVDAFVASYNNYLDQSEEVTVDNYEIIKVNATIHYENLVGSTSDNISTITTTFKFDVGATTLPDQIEHYISLDREKLWQYTDLGGQKIFTVDNNVTISAPEGWKIVYTRGLLNETYSEDLRVLEANANLGFDRILIKISKEAEDNNQNIEDDGLNDMILSYFVIGGVITAFLLTIIGLTYRRRNSLKSAKEIPNEDRTAPLTEAEIKILTEEKDSIQKEILEVRKNLRMETITKDVAKSKERALKEKYKEIEKQLKSGQKPGKGVQ